MALSYAIPRIESSVITQGGTMSRDWYLFFSALLQTVGGPSVVAGGGIDPIAVQQQYEEYAITSLEAVEALRGVEELRKQFVVSESPRIHELMVIVDELRNELQTVRSENNAYRNRIETIEGRLG